MKALIIIDMQNDFITGSLANSDAAKIIPGIVNEINSGKYQRIFYTQDTHDDNYLLSQEGRYLPVPHCIKYTDGWDVQKDIKAALDKSLIAYGIQKGTFGYYLFPEVIERLKDLEEIVIVGTCTDICVVSNAIILKSAFPEVKISVLSSLCAGTSVEAHNAALTVMRQCQINII